MSQDVNDRRKTPRTHLIHYLQIFDRVNGQLVGQLVDITPDGIMMLCEKPVERDYVFQFRMEFPEEVGGRSDLCFDAIVVWCKVDINPDIYALGLRLLNIKREEAKIIEWLIDMYRDE